jgi:UDP-glucose 6-dehydrogenase
MKVVIFGKGKVGMATDLTLKTNADFHDPAKGHEVKDFTQYDLAIICVSSLNEGPYDHQAIQECLSTLHDTAFAGTIAIRCTVAPVFLRAWNIQYPNLNLIHFPEFMKQGDDVYLDKPWILVLGGDRKLTVPFGKWLVDNGYGHEEMWHFCTVEESALIKLHQNAGLALKVVYANIMYEACQAYGADYDVVRKGVAADTRVGPGHLAVPGEHGFGFAGHCLPKDLRCLDKVSHNRGFWENILNVNEQLKAKNV